VNGEKPAHQQPVGELGQLLREAAGLTHCDVSGATAIGLLTHSNLELVRGSASAAISEHLPTHPALADLPRLAAEAGLLPFPAWLGNMRNPQDGVHTVPVAVGTGGAGAGDNDGSRRTGGELGIGGGQ
jgi:hypothetical protein